MIEIGGMNFYKLKRFLGVMFILSVMVASADVNYEQELTDTAYIDFLNINSYELGFSNVDSGIVYGNKALNYAIKNNYPEGVCLGYLNVAYMYWIKTQYDTALTLYHKSLELSANIDFFEGIVKSKNGIANVYFQYGNHAKALEYYLLSLKAAEQINYQRGKSVALNNIGLIYVEQGKYEKALEYYDRSKSISSEIMDANLYMSTLNNIGTVYYKLKNYEESLRKHYKTLNYFKTQNANQYIAESYIYLGNNYLKIENYDKAEKKYKDALEYAEKSKGTEPRCNAILGVSKVLFNKNKYNDALKWANEGLQHTKKANHGMLLRDYYMLLSKIYEKTGDINMAYNSFKEYHMHSDSIFNSQIEKKTAFLDAQYEFEKKEEELKNQQALQEIIYQKEVSKWRFAFIIGAIIIIFTTSGVVFINRNRRNLRKSNEDLEVAYYELDEYKTELLQLNSTKDKFFSIIAHDLKSPFNSILGLSSILKNEIIENNTEKALQFAESLNKTSIRLYDLLENLLLWSKTQNGKFDFNPAPLNLRLLAKEVAELLEETAKSKNILIKINVDSDIIVDADRSMIATVFRNLVSNAIKFTPEKGQIIVESRKTNSKVEVSVIDNGKGISKANIKKLLGIDETYTTKGTLNEEGSGLGLLICKDFLELHGSDICVESEVNKGSRFSFMLSVHSSIN